MPRRCRLPPPLPCPIFKPTSSDLYDHTNTPSLLFPFFCALLISVPPEKESLVGRRENGTQQAWRDLFSPSRHPTHMTMAAAAATKPPLLTPSCRPHPPLRPLSLSLPLSLPLVCCIVPPPPPPHEGQISLSLSCPPTALVAAPSTPPPLDTAASPCCLQIVKKKTPLLRRRAVLWWGAACSLTTAISKVRPLSPHDALSPPPLSNTCHPRLVFCVRCPPLLPAAPCPVLPVLKRPPVPSPTRAADSVFFTNVKRECAFAWGQRGWGH